MNSVSFDVRGYMAHFRKVFSNSTSLTYMFPPRTTIMGMIAAAMGKPRDSYYEELSPERLRLAVRLLTEVRKLKLSENYLNTDEVSVRALRGLKGRVPTAREFVVSGDGWGPLGYRIYACGDAELVGRIADAVRAPAYPLSLGSADMPAWVEDVREGECEPLGRFSGDEAVSSVVRFSLSLALREEDLREGGLRIMLEERVPRLFDGGRRSGVLENYYLEIGGRPIRVRGEAEGASIGGEVISFL
ncbi:MAG: CRISPR-associated protein Cas5 [Nitrososphaeria archaeon]